MLSRCGDAISGPGPIKNGVILNTELVSFWGAEIGIDGERFLPVAAALGWAPAGLAGAGQASVCAGPLVAVVGLGRQVSRGGILGAGGGGTPVARSVSPRPLSATASPYASPISR